MVLALITPIQPARAAPMGPLVVQGVEALPRGKFPWQVRLADENFARQTPLAHLVGLFCGGVLISPT
jgi:hypothetical protein